MAGVATSDMWDQVIDYVVLTVPNATLAPQIFDPRMNPSPNMDAGLSFALPTSRNTGNYRDQDSVRGTHRLTVGYAHRLKMSNQHDSIRTALILGDQIIYVFGKTHPLLRMRADWVGTRRAMTPAREHLIVQVDFDITIDLDRAT